MITQKRLKLIGNKLFFHHTLSRRSWQVYPIYYASYEDSSEIATKRLHVDDILTTNYATNKGMMQIDSMIHNLFENINAIKVKAVNSRLSSRQYRDILNILTKLAPYYNRILIENPIGKLMPIPLTEAYEKYFKKVQLFTFYKGQRMNVINLKKQFFGNNTWFIVTLENNIQIESDDMTKNHLDNFVYAEKIN